MSCAAPQEVLSDSDQVPADAWDFGLQPLVLADQVVFPGARGLYAVATKATDAGPSSGTAAAASQQSSTADSATGPDAERKDKGLLWSFAAPPGFAMSASDMLGMHEGLVLWRLGADPSAPASPPPAPQAELALGSNADGVGSVPLGADDGAGTSGSSAQDWGTEQREALILGLDSAAGEVKWQASIPSSAGPMVRGRPLPYDFKAGLLLVDGCANTTSGGANGTRPPPDKHGRSSGSMCCLSAVDVASGQVAWQQCFDVGEACKKGAARDLGLSLVYTLLALQVGGAGVSGCEGEARGVLCDGRSGLEYAPLCYLMTPAYFQKLVTRGYLLLGTSAATIPVAPERMPF